MIYFSSLLILIASYYLFKNASGSMAFNKLNMISMIFYFYLVLLSYFGATLIASGFGINSALNHVSLENRIFGWIVISYVMLAVPCGILMSKILLRIKNVNIIYHNYINSDLYPLLSEKDSYIRLFLYLLSILSIFSVFYMILKVGEIPQIKLFFLSTHIDVLTLRTTINRDFAGIYQIKSVLFEQLTPLLSFISYSYYRMTHLYKDKIWFYLMLLLTMFMLTFTLSKSPVVGYFITFLLLKIYIDGAREWKYFILSFIGFTVILIVSFMLVVRDGNFNFISVYLLNRILFDQVSGTFLMFQIFPDIYDYVGFASLSKPLSNLWINGYSEPASRLAAEYAYSGATGGGYMNLLSTLFIGESWANYGWYGIIISPIYVGMLVGAFYYLILKFKKTPILVGFLALFSFRVCFGTSFNLYIYNSTVFVIFFLFILSYILALMIKQRKRQ